MWGIYSSGQEIKGAKMGLVGDNMPLLYICRPCEEDCDQLAVFTAPGVTKNEVTLHQLQAVENPHATVTTARKKTKNKKTKTKQSHMIEKLKHQQWTDEPLQGVKQLCAT